MDQSTARTLAREIGKRAKEHGCHPSNEDDPSIIELAAQCNGRGVDIHAILVVR